MSGVHPFRRVLDVLADLTVVGSFSSLGYKLRAPAFDDADLAVDLSGKVVVITGASSGIGLAAARALAQKGASLALVARHPDKLAAAAATVSGTGHVRTELCDLSDLHDACALAARLATLPRIDVLIHNAGLLPLERQRTPQGHELAFATHVLAPFLLTELLTPALEQSAPSRVVWVTSGGMYTQRLDLEKAQALTGPYDGVVAYAQQKRAQVLLMEGFAQRLQERGITSNAMHPGWADTPGVARSLPQFKKVMQQVLRNEDEGADTLVWLACAPRLAEVTGGLFLDRAARRTEVLPGTRHTAADAEALWSLCAKHTASR